MKNVDLQRIKHIKKYCIDITNAISRFGEDKEMFLTDIDYRNSISMSLMQIGELCIGLSDEFKESTKTQMQWELIRGMRNMFAHTYAKMEKSVIWDTAIKDIPMVLEFCNKILKQEL